MGGHYNKDLLTMSSPAVLHSALYAVLQAPRTLKRRWLPDLRCSISDSQPTPLNQPPGTTTKKDEDEDRLTMGTSEPAALLRVADDNREWSTGLDTSPPMWPADYRAHWGCSRRSHSSGRRNSPSLPFLNLLSDKRGTMGRWQSSQVLQTALTEEKSRISFLTLLIMMF